jgi:hypothetical protein
MEKKPKEERGKERRETGIEAGEGKKERILGRGTQPAQPAPIYPTSHPLNPHGYFHCAWGDGFEFPEPALCGVSEKNADTCPALCPPYQYHT